MTTKPDANVGLLADEDFPKNSHSRLNPFPLHGSYCSPMLETHCPGSLPSSSSYRKQRSQSPVSSSRSISKDKPPIYNPEQIQDLSAVLNSSGDAIDQSSVAPPSETAQNVREISFIASPQHSTHAVARRNDKTVPSSSSSRSAHPFVSSEPHIDADASHLALLSDEKEYVDVLDEASCSDESLHSSSPVHNDQHQESKHSLPIAFDHKNPTNISNDQIFLSSSCPTQHGFPSHSRDSLKDIQPDPDLSSLPKVQLMLLGADDSEIKKNALTQVDYLSHDWKETDIWASWREITKSKNNYENGLRLENASWRSWIKYKYHLPTISPETLNWLKECDVTWLYGPLLHASMPTIHNSQMLKQKSVPNDSNQNANDHPDSASEYSSQNSLTKKPILKRRSPQEVLLSGRDITPRSQTSRLDNYLRYPPNDTPVNPNIFGLRPPIFRQSPSSQPSRRIHFNDRVQQCIAVDVDHSTSENSSATESNEYAASEDTKVSDKKSDESSSEVLSDSSRSAQPNAGRIIVDLPDSTLKASIEDQMNSLDNKNYGGSYFAQDGRSRFPRVPEYYGENDFEEDEIYREDRHYGGFQDYDHNVIYDGDDYNSDEDTFTIEDVNEYRGEQCDDSSNDESQFLEYANDKDSSDEDNLSESPSDHDSVPSSPYSVFSRTPPDTGSMGSRSIYSPYQQSPNESNFSRSVDERVADGSCIDINGMVSNKHKAHIKSHNRRNSSSLTSFSKQISPAAPTTAENLQTVSLGPSSARSSMESEENKSDVIDVTRAAKAPGTQGQNARVQSSDATDGEFKQTNPASFNANPTNWLVDMLQNKLKSWNE
ncbi:protein phosphatase regulatory subunit Reg1 [Schizosaccharomyces cryophilus OY26]|uniref:Protein phosphatase regulatory subunit Reg1 n=1 Tax=Schizosaccharomyces cryophilus (strain OY26 / ATCC MYA-4695 / CBS 11777 / NBRC 106824 / NRRL Y48691) TaxID=653667 RepID=S9VU53_SCHCR|nr:protein phosphatase regulatory subunit Reg1 [Schizosaccharomyces cryophilus OY26]EPY49640.1 protein phosphatase regulatory subunit Reg1 [Schizosaccharomyces cryophilus OY26]